VSETVTTVRAQYSSWCCVLAKIKAKLLDTASDVRDRDWHKERNVDYKLLKYETQTLRRTEDFQSENCEVETYNKIYFLVSTNLMH